MSKHLTLVSWNLHGIPFTQDPAARFRRVAERVRGLQPAPDLLLLQEVWDGALADQLALDLPGYGAAPELERGWLGQRPSGLMALARRDGPWRIADSVMHEFDAHAPWYRLWEGDGLGRKGVQQLRVAAGDDEVMLLHTHLQAMYGRPEYAPIAAKQLGQLTSVAQALGQARPIIAAGDLNTGIDTPRYAELRERWVDLTAEFRERCACGTSVREDGRPGRWIDYVLAYDLPRFRVRADVQLLANHAPDDPYSDHNGFFVKLQIERAPSAAWILGAALALGGGRQPVSRRDLLRGAGAAVAVALTESCPGWGMSAVL
jgi:endonuclease/exonuclease/phosphatase family metal-dependent hydrolase